MVSFGPEKKTNNSGSLFNSVEIGTELQDGTEFPKPKSGFLISSCLLSQTVFCCCFPKFEIIDRF